MAHHRARRLPPQRLNPAALLAVASAFAFVLKGYPRLSETFIAQEIHALGRAGRRNVAANFDMRGGIERLLGRFREARAGEAVV